MSLNNKFFYFLYIFFSYHYLITFQSSYDFSTKKFVIILDTTFLSTEERIIDNNFEHNLCIQFADYIKNYINNNKKIVIKIVKNSKNHNALEHAQYINMQHSDIYIKLNCFKAQQSVCYFYYYLQQPSDVWHKNNNNMLTFIPYDKAHYLHHTQIKKYIQKIDRAISSASNNIFCNKPYGLPCKSLTGIITPALALELGIRNKDDLLSFVEPIAISLLACAYEV